MCLLVLSTPPSDAQSMDLGAISKALEARDCGRFACDEYDARANATSTLVTPGPPAVATTPMTGIVSDGSEHVVQTLPLLRKHKEWKRKKVVRNSRNNSSQVTTTESPP